MKDHPWALLGPLFWANHSLLSPFPTLIALPHRFVYVCSFKTGIVLCSNIFNWHRWHCPVDLNLFPTFFLLCLIFKIHPCCCVYRIVPLCMHDVPHTHFSREGHQEGFQLPALINNPAVGILLHTPNRPVWELFNCSRLSTRGREHMRI